MNTHHDDRMRARRFYLFIAACICIFILATTASNALKREHHDDVNVTQNTNTYHQEWLKK